jgi:hypothetical protein
MVWVLEHQTLSQFKWAPLTLGALQTASEKLLGVHLVAIAFRVRRPSPKLGQADQAQPVDSNASHPLTSQYVSLTSAFFNLVKLRMDSLWASWLSAMGAAREMLTPHFSLFRRPTKIVMCGFVWEGQDQFGPGWAGTWQRRKQHLSP